MATLTVGRNGQYATIAAAVAAARNGDTVSVAAGTYTDDVAVIRTTISLVASGGIVVMHGKATLPSGGALLTVASTATVDGFVFTGAHATDGSAAGLLHTAGALTVRNSLFTGNQNGLLSTATGTASLTVTGSEFTGNGNGGGFSGNIAVGALQSLSISGSYVHGALGGDEVKSLAHTTAVTNTRIEDLAAAAATLLSLPNGGNVTVKDSVLQHGANSTAATAIRFGGGTAYANSSLTLSGNTAVTDKQGGLLVQNTTTATASINANVLYGFNGAKVNSGLAAMSANTVPASRPALSTAALIAYGVGTQYGREGAVTANGTVLSVGVGGQYPTLAAALAATHDGDTIDLAAGTYAISPVTVSHKVIIQGVNGLASFTQAATASPGTPTAVPALFTVTADTTFRNVVISGVGLPGGTEAAILDQGANLTITNSVITDNQLGVAATGASATVGIYDTELSRNGTPNGANGNVQVGAIDTLALVNDYVHDALAGAEISSRATYTTVDATRIDQAAGNGTADLLLPDGGQVSVTGSAIQKGANAQNTPLIQVGGGTVAAGSTLAVTNTVLISDQPTSVFIASDPAVTTTVTAATVVGGAEDGTLVTNGTATGTTTATAVAVNTASPWTHGVSAFGNSVAPVNSVTVAAAAAGMAARGVLVLDVSGTAFQGNAQFQVFVDGAALGGTLTAQASHAAGQSQAFSIGGTYAAGPHTVQVQLVNALAGNGGGTGRALFIDGMQFNGETVAGAATSLAANGIITLSTAAPVASPTPVTVNLSEDAWHGDAQALITIDGKVQNGLQTVIASHAAGQTEPMRFLLDLLPGAHTLGVTFLNDASGPGGDRNLYIDSLDVASQHYSGAAASLLTGGTSTYAFTVAPPAAPTNANLFVRSGLAGAASLIVPTS